MWPLHTRNTKNKQSEKGPGRGLFSLLVCMWYPFNRMEDDFLWWLGCWIFKMAEKSKRFQR